MSVRHPYHKRGLGPFFIDPRVHWITRCKLFQLASSILSIYSLPCFPMGAVRALHVGQPLQLLQDQREL